MIEIQASEAKTHLPRLLDDVERCTTIAITRHGRRIARIVPETELRREEIAAAIRDIDALRGEPGGMTIGEILAARHEGHRY
jgi:prevent-host-death family protein